MLRLRSRAHASAGGDGRARVLSAIVPLGADVLQLRASHLHAPVGKDGRADVSVVAAGQEVGRVLWIGGDGLPAVGRCELPRVLRGRSKLARNHVQRGVPGLLARGKAEAGVEEERLVHGGRVARRDQALPGRERRSEELAAEALERLVVRGVARSRTRARDLGGLGLQRHGRRGLEPSTAGIDLAAADAGGVCQIIVPALSVPVVFAVAP